MYSILIISQPNDSKIFTLLYQTFKILFMICWKWGIWWKVINIQLETGIIRPVPNYKSFHRLYGWYFGIESMLISPTCHVVLFATKFLGWWSFWQFIQVCFVLTNIDSYFPSMFPPYPIKNWVSEKCLGRIFNSTFLKSKETFFSSSFSFRFSLYKKIKPFKIQQTML